MLSGQRSKNQKKNTRNCCRFNLILHRTFDEYKKYSTKICLPLISVMADSTFSINKKLKTYSRTTN